MQLLEPYNGDQTSDAIQEVRVPGTSAGDTVLRHTVVPNQKFWELRLNNDNNDEWQFLWNGTTNVFTLGTDAIPNFYQAKGTGTFTAELGTTSPAGTLTPVWLKATWGTIPGVFPFFPL